MDLRRVNPLLDSAKRSDDSTLIVGV